MAEPMWFGTDVEDAFTFITARNAGSIRDLPDDGTRAAALADLRASLSEHQTDHGVTYQSAALLIQARRT